MSEYRGGLHGEASASHDEKKVNGEEDDQEICETIEGQAVGPQCEATASCEDRQSHQGCKEIDEVNSEEEGFTMTAEDLTPKAKVASALGSMFNDPRITNVLMLVLVLIGMGGAEAVQSQVCSL